jgi:hypothetical protein
MIGEFSSRLAPAFGVRVTGYCLALSIVSGTPDRGLAQTVSADIMLRDGALAGSAGDLAVAFEPGATYVAWRDTRNNATTGGDIYAQKLGPDGALLWEVNGLAICTAEGIQQLPAITPDGAGGAEVVWLDHRGDRFKAIAGQRISASGAVQGGTDGQFIGVVLLEQPRPFVHRASDGGFLITWWDAEPIFNPADDRVALLAQKLDHDGQPQWDPDGSGPGDLWGPGIEVMNGILRGRSVPDGAGGFLAFGKLQNGRGFRFQRVASDGSMPWAAPVDYDASLDDFVPFNFAADGTGGVVVVYRVASTLRGFRVTADGSLAWGATGIEILTSNLNTAQNIAVTGDGQGGAFVAWIANSPRDVRVQRLSANGTAQWAAEGLIVPNLDSLETDPAIVADGSGGIFVSFDTISFGVRGQRLDSSGTAQWLDGGNIGLHLGVGNVPIIGQGSTGPVVIYSRSSGLFARIIEVADPSYLQLTGFEFSAQAVTMTLNGGVPGSVYEVLRTTALANPLSQSAWTLVGTIEPGASWADNNPPSTGAFYVVSEPAP